MIEFVIAVVIGTLLITLVSLSIMSYFSPKNVWFCNKMGWHYAPLQQGFDGISSNGECPRCKKHVLQDSQGNWF